MLALSAAILMAAQAVEPLRLNLICEGAGTQRKPATSTARVFTSTGAWANGNITTWRDADFADAVRIEIAGEGGRVRIPQTMLPPIRGGKNGWMTLRKVQATPDEITAVATINLFNKAKLRIDRIAGTLSMTVLQGEFSGKCQAYDPDTVERAF